MVIGASGALQKELEEVLLMTGRFGLVRMVGDYPSEHDVGRMVRAHAPQCIFLCVDRLEEAIRVRGAVERTVSGVPVVAFSRMVNQKTLVELMRNGVREFLPMPFQAPDLYDLADRLDDYLAQNPLSVETSDLLFSFLPAKPGVGTSTVAINLGVALSRLPNNRVLLADFDLNSGLIGFMLKLHAQHSVVDAVLRCDDLDENLWPNLVANVANMDVLPCGRTEPGLRIQPAQIHRLTGFARRHYGVICADLSGNLEKYSVELMLDSKRIFLVTTPEIPPLHLARERNRFLCELDLGDRVSILLNRWSRRSAITVKQIEDLLDAPVFATLPNDYTGVHEALVAGRPITEDLDLGQAFRDLARRIMEPAAAAKEAEAPRKKSFLEVFSIR
jgi:pilus assembly protein CpaE